MQGILLLLYGCFVITIIGFAIFLSIRFVRAQERIAEALESIARKLRDDGES